MSKKNIKKAKILSDDGIYLEVEINKFYKHLLKYHSRETSIHEEKGHFFTINNNFRKEIKRLVEK